MLAHLGAFLVRLGASTLVLLLGVAWVSPRNPRNTLSRAAVVSLVLSVAWYLTLARFLWFLLLPLLLYLLVWSVVVAASYRLGLLRSILLALALTFLSFLVSTFFGIRTL